MKRPFQRLLRRLLLTLFSIFWMSIFLVIPWGFLPLPTTSFMVQNALSHGRPYHYRWTAYKNMNPVIGLAAIAAEDQRFPDHNGFDLEAIEAALKDYNQGSSLRGASTISQQVARNLFLWSGRSAFRKVLEAWFTILIELFWSKERILTVYLNVAQFGDRTFGVGAASRDFFDLRPRDLTPDEAALLAAVLPGPELYSVLDPSWEVLDRQAWILAQMAQLGGIDYLNTLDRQKP